MTLNDLTSGIPRSVGTVLGINVFFNYSVTINVLLSLCDTNDAWTIGLWPALYVKDLIMIMRCFALAIYATLKMSKHTKYNTLNLVLLIQINA